MKLYRNRNAEGMRNMVYSITFETPLGLLHVIECEDAIVQIHFVQENTKPFADAFHRETALLLEAKRQLTEYFAGARKIFSLPLHASGTAFQKQVWKQLEQIPYGETRSYGEIAKAIGNPKAARAVGSANHCNPIAIVVPCHRVIGATGKLVGYAGGLEIKRSLLELEKDNCI